MFSSKNKYTGLEIPFSYKGKESINIIQDKNNCEYIGNFKWKCNRGENCFIGFESKPFGDMSGDSDLEDLLDSLIAKLSNKKFNINELNKENNEIIKKILTADFYCEESDKNEASGINIGWYYEDGDKKKLNEFKIFTKYSQYKSKGKTPTNYLEKKNESEKTDDTTGLKSVISEIENGKSFMNGHHIIGSEWARANIDEFIYEDGNENNPIKFYDENEAPVILLRDTYEDSSHQTITKKQVKRRVDKRTEVSYSKEKEFARKELQEIVVSEKNIGLDINKLSNKDRVAIKILQAWELHQIEFGLSKADEFYGTIRETIRNEVKKSPKKYKYLKDNVFADESNIDTRLEEIFK